MLTLTKWEIMRKKSDVEEELERLFPGCITCEIYLHMELLRVKKKLEYAILTHEEAFNLVMEVIEGIRGFILDWDEDYSPFFICSFYDILLFNHSLFIDYREALDYFPLTYKINEYEDTYISIINFIVRSYMDDKINTNTVILDLPNKRNAKEYILTYCRLLREDKDYRLQIG